MTSEPGCDPAPEIAAVNPRHHTSSGEVHLIIKQPFHGALPDQRLGLESAADYLLYYGKPQDALVL